jgi:hypothetical protein
MSEDASSLKKELLKWAEGNEGDATEWMHELDLQKIRDMRSLRKRAEGSRWQSTLDKLSDALATELESWFLKFSNSPDKLDGHTEEEALLSSEMKKSNFPVFKKAKYEVDLKSWPTRSEFSQIRFSKDIPYVDKTSYFLDLFRLGSVFISRPRRFGKTLLVNTLKALFLGQKDLFKGLHVEAKWDWETNKYPVIKLDFSSCFPASFMKDLIDQLIHAGKEYSVSFEKVELLLGNVFRHLVSELSSRYSSNSLASSFVLLIDEYDKPVIDCLDDLKLVEENLQILKTFLQMVKSVEPVFSLVTGSSRLARSGIFSGDNNRVDITFFSEFNAICGFTESEIKQSLHLYLENLKFDDLKDWYNGYSFDGRGGVYNPYSIVSAIVYQKLSPYWVRSGTTNLLGRFCGTAPMKELIMNLLDDTKIEIADCDIDIEVSESIESLGKSTESLTRLFLQSGYLTIMQSSGSQNREFLLHIPNKEIREHALTTLTASALLGIKEDDLKGSQYFVAFRKAISLKDIPSLYQSIFDLFQIIGYPDRGTIDKKEDYYQRIMQAFFIAVCKDVHIEYRTSSGKCDLVVDFRDRKWKILFEFKLLHGGKDKNASHKDLESTIREAFNQVDNQYLIAINPDTVCILVFNSGTRTLFPISSLNGLQFFRQNSAK